MPGPIGLLGGREHYEPMLSVDRCFLDQVGVFRPEVVILPVASFRGQAAAAGALAVSHWSRLGARARAVIPASDYDHVALEMIEGADVIVLPGGLPNRLISALGTPLHEAIAFRWEAGAGVTGSSAGAMGLFEWRLNLYPPDPFGLIPGLGLLGGFVVAPHFDRLRARRWCRPFLGRMGGLAVLGIDESTGLIGRDGEMHVLGRGAVTTASREGIEVWPAGSKLGLSTSQISARLRLDPPLDHIGEQGQGHRPADQQDVVEPLDVEIGAEAALGLTA
jgi:cyanophycinase-like exopeptidase